MEATFLAKKAFFNIPKFLSQGPPGILSARKITKACFSSAFERAEGSNAVAEAAENVGDSAKKTMDGAWRAAKDGAQGFQEGAAGDEFAEDVAVDEIRKVDQLVDTQEYRSIEELKKLD
ncbi:hypothetical protein like AT3G15280 [Hibiscus trionum]|uniref:Uncharacterized protein n=1 Tax=Hibiscus trionum TaxID=183268 RepID=A0A9W7MMU2_HIBTR|nr:hypothetical protein like AT3G15280 [Hibiscus trionum]